ncbi:MAG: isoleucine--tRNA ligase, partial [Candidatus Aenigmarchaeota archaeon]|nr:isoleucine--tRNA ligase [Candidatus Aenigmarchaeota archaeon]
MTVMKVEQGYDFKRIEAEVSAHWQVNKDLIKQSIMHNPKRKLFSWLEGPPTANAPPGLHHVEVRVFKDVMCRFKYMQGFSVPRKGGWDCHGLPVEVQVEKKLGLKSKKDVIAFGVDKFNAQCKEDIFKFIKDWSRVTERLAFWVDLENPYKTLDTPYIESVWWSLKELHKKELLYEGHKVVPYCPRCETALSSHEVALGYKDVSEPALTVKFALKDHPHRKLLAWTTTPWTLPSNLALAVNPHVAYAVVKHGEEELVLAKELVPKYFTDAKIISEINGSELVGREYSPLFDYFSNKLQGAWKVIPAEYVSVEEGTGIVHQAPAFGEDDYETCKANGIPFLQPVSADGKFTEEVRDYAGMFVKSADKQITNDLDRKGAVFKVENYTHSYPFCWRCSTPLLYYALSTWFVAVSKFREKLVASNEKIAWYPEHIREGRFGNWLSGAKDWALSRKRYWATPLPIWKCDAGHVVCVGSIKELKKLSTAPVDEQKIDLHKPFVDDIKLKCECKKEMTRVADVIDCWYDSGSAPFAQFHYPFENKKEFKKRFPYDFIAEAIDQTRGWFYTLHVLGTLLFDNVSYKRCAVGGLLCDEKGEKMSKSKGNILNPEEVFDKVGVDAVRLLMCYYPLGEQIRFGMAQFNDAISPFLKILWNSFYYAHEFFSLQNIDGKTKARLTVEDKWVLSRLNTVTAGVTKFLDNGKYSDAVTLIQQFVNGDLSRTYIKFIRNRAGQPDTALAFTLRKVFDKIILLLAPFAPYTAEAMYLRHSMPDCREKSVHFAHWPKAEKTLPELEQRMTAAREIITAALSLREKIKVGVRWPLKQLVIESGEEASRKAASVLKNIIKEQLNVKKIIVTDKHAHVETETAGDWQNGKIFFDTASTPALELEGIVRELMRNVQELRKKSGLQKQDKALCHIQTSTDLSTWKQHIADKVGASELTISTETSAFENKTE